MEEDFILFKKVKEKPIRDCIDLSRNMIGRRNGIFYFTENFRIDFENRMSRLVELEREIYKLKNELENNRKQYQETYKDVREELKELQKENEELKENYKVLENAYITDSIPKSVIQDKIEELGISDTDILIRYTLEEILRGNK